MPEGVLRSMRTLWPSATEHTSARAVMAPGACRKEFPRGDTGETLEATPILFRRGKTTDGSVGGGVDLHVVRLHDEDVRPGPRRGGAESLEIIQRDFTGTGSPIGWSITARVEHSRRHDRHELGSLEGSDAARHERS